MKFYFLMCWKYFLKGQEIDEKISIFRYVLNIYKMCEKKKMFFMYVYY